MRKQYYFRPSAAGLLAWDVDRLVERSRKFTVRAVPLAEIQELDNAVFGSDEERTWRSFAAHCRLVREAELKYPIIRAADGAVMDGMHRVCKALIEGRDTIDAMQFDTDPEPDYVGRRPDELPYDRPPNERGESDESKMSRPPAVLVVVGASGAGKSTLTRALAALGMPGVVCHHFDTIGVPAAEEIAARFGDGAAWQGWALDQWVRRLVRNDDGATLATLDAQVRPHSALDALQRHGVMHGRVVLVDCSYSERNARLRGPRGQPELATPDMDCFAAYMRGQADALGLPVLDTTGRPVAACLAELRRHCDELLAAAGSATATDDERNA
jgi:hypothetical protein